MTPEHFAGLEQARQDFERVVKERDSAVKSAHDAAQIADGLRSQLSRERAESATMHTHKIELEHEIDRLKARVAELEAKLADPSFCVTAGDARCANALRLRDQAMRQQDRADALEAKYAGIEQMLSLYSSPPGAKLVDVLAGALARGLNAADERDQLKAKLAESSEGFLRKLHERNEEKLELEKKLAAMPEPVVIDLELASHVLTAFKQAHADSPYLSMLSALRGVLGERVVVKDPEADKLPERAEMLAEVTALDDVDCDEERQASEANSPKNFDGSQQPAEATVSVPGFKPVVVKLVNGTNAEPIKLEPSDPSVANDKARVLKEIENRCCSDRDYGHDGVHPVEVRIQTQRQKIIELQKKLEEAEAARTTPSSPSARRPAPRIVAMHRMSTQEMDARLEEMANSPKNLDGSQPAPKLPDGWEYASPADKLRPNDRHALRHVEPNPKAERLKERLASAHGLVESLQSELRALRGAMDVFISKLGRCADERVHNGG